MESGLCMFDYHMQMDLRAGVSFSFKESKGNPTKFHKILELSKHILLPLCPFTARPIGQPARVEVGLAINYSNM